MSALRFACSFAIATLFFGVPAAAARPHPFGVDDWQTLRSAAPIAVAPDGATILYSVAFGQRQGPTKTELFTIRADGSGKTKLELPKDFHAAGFTRSARELYGTQATKTVDQLALWTVGAKKARIISNVPGGVTSVRLSPDGSRFALIGKPQPPDPLAKLRTVVENETARLYVTSAAGTNGAWWCRERDHASEFAWSQDGTRIALVEQTPLLGYHRVTSAIDVCSATSDRRLATFDRGATSVAWTARDTMLAFLSTTTDVLTPDHVWTIPVSGGKPLDRTPDIPFSILALHGDAHGRIWTGVAAGLEAKVAEFRDGKLGRTFTNGSVVSMPVSTDLASAPGVLAFGVSTTVHPSEVAVGSTGALHTITHESDAQLAHIAFGTVIRHRWTSADGTQLEAMVTFPPKWNGKPGKFLVLPHGGPEANDHFTLDEWSRIIASHGFVVMQPEYRGSTGYGSAHLQAIYQHFGDTAYRDVDAATTEAVARGWADPKRLAIFGWSAGGFMTAWTVTQTARYRAAIEGAGITEWLSFLLTSDLAQIDYDASDLSAGAEPFLKYSPVMYAQNVTTPLLILHGESDGRVPAYQGREFFVLLKDDGKTVRMVTYPGSGHFPRLWEQRRNVFDELLHWLARYDP